MGGGSHLVLRSDFNTFECNSLAGGGGVYVGGALVCGRSCGLWEELFYMGGAMGGALIYGRSCGLWEELCYMGGAMGGAFICWRSYYLWEEL